MKRIRIVFAVVFISVTSVVAAQNTSKPEVMRLLDSIYNDDQLNRHKSDSLVKIYGWGSDEVKSLWKIIQNQDSVNLVKVKKIIEQNGWLGPHEIGRRGNQTLFLVIQHADSLTQVTYLPFLRNAVKDGKAMPQDLALLEDRILMKQGKQQIYGSQVILNSKGNFEFYPIADEMNVNNRRKSVGLEPIEDYAKYFGIDYKSLNNK